MSEIKDIVKKLEQILAETESKREVEDLFNSSRELMSAYRCAIMEIETKFNVLNDYFSLQHERNPIETITSRLKSPESIKEKLIRRGYPISLESIENNLFDIAGVRVICSFIDDIYMLADCLLAQDDITLIEKKDYIKNPKPNGYRSLHLRIEVPIFLQNTKKKVKVEVQLRTIAMEFWAKLEHRLRYKKHLDEKTINYTSDELLECANLCSTLDTKMQNIRNIIEK